MVGGRSVFNVGGQVLSVVQVPLVAATSAAGVTSVGPGAGGLPFGRCEAPVVIGRTPWPPPLSNGAPSGSEPSDVYGVMSMGPLEALCSASIPGA